MKKLLKYLVLTTAVVTITACTPAGNGNASSSLTHEELVARISSNLQTVASDTQLLAQSAAAIAPSASIVASAVGAKPDVISDISTAGKASAQIAATLNAINLANVPANTQVITTSTMPSATTTAVK